MPDSQIRVRLVPRNREGGTLPANLFAATPATAKAVAPEPERARAALDAAFNLGIPAALSTRNVLDGQVPADRFRELFGTELVEERVPETAARATTMAQTYLAPAGELTVPAALSDLVAFAYVPTPPQFFAPRAMPPNAAIYHLRIEDVARALRAYRCHRLGWTGRGVRVAMTDTGFAAHPFFEDYGFNIERANTPATSNPAVDTNGHGTGECANVLVIAPDCAFIGVKHDDYSALALETALAQSPQVVTNSWGWDIDRQSMESLRVSNPNLYNEARDVANIIADAIDDGVTMIFAGGNGHYAFPASLPDVIAVGGVTVYSDGSRRASSYASSFASQLYPGRRVPDFCGVVGEYNPPPPLRGHIMLPVPNGSELEGENLPSTLQNRGWGIFSGTSAAAPQVAGVAALMLSVNPQLRPAEIKSILAATARDVTQGRTAHGATAGPGADLATGSGFVDAFAACLRVQQLHPPG
jgi:subtilisin family serine protease